MNCGQYSISTFTSDTPINSHSNSNQIWLFDRSGSMSNTIEALCEDLIGHATQLKIGDTLTIGWFSGDNQHDIILKGFRINNDTDHQFIERAIRANNHVIGCTCFSQSFQALKSVIVDLKAIFSNNVALFLFTDGYPVVSNYKKEIADLFEAIDGIKDDLSTTLIIGYGDGYNKSLLLSMAERIGGSVIHNSSLKETAQTLTDFIHSATASRNSISVPIGNILMACSYSNGRLYLYDPSQSTYSIVGTELHVLHTNHSDEPVQPQAIYALSAGLVQKAKSDQALVLLNTIGDKFVMDRIINAFSNSEYGNAEHALMQAISDESFRYREGRIDNYLPAEDAFCLLDLLHLLMQDQEARFYVKHPAFNYKRITKQHKSKEGTAKFVPDRSVGVPLSGLTFHKEKLNLSILVAIPGTVSFPDINLENYATFQYRNFSLIRNGILNVDILPITCGAGTLEVLRAHNLVQESDDVLLLNLRGVPIINKFLTKNRRSAKLLADQATRALILEARLKVFNNKKRVVEHITEVVDDALLTRGIKRDGSYAPETVTDKSVTDYYMATVFKIKIKGCSTMPKVDAVEAKMGTTKRMNFLESHMATAILETRNGDLDRLCEDAKHELLTVRRFIQETKFALSLTKSWFEEFDQRTNCTIVSDYGIETSFEIEEQKVLID